VGVTELEKQTLHNSKNAKILALTAPRLTNLARQGNFFCKVLAWSAMPLHQASGCKDRKPCFQGGELQSLYMNGMSSSSASKKDPSKASGDPCMQTLAS